MDDHAAESESESTAADVILRSLREYGVEYVFGNFGTDHTPLLEAAARIREDDPDAIPEFVTCPHESGALSAADGYAAVTGRPQAVFVHVDVGTQNLGAMVHNAHRGDAPVFIFAGLAPITHGEEPGARSSGIQYIQDVYDQDAIVEQYCRWTGEYRPPADPDEFVARGLELASTPRRGPSYLTATREALETPVDSTPGSHSLTDAGPVGADAATVDRLASMVREADAPLVVDEAGVGPLWFRMRSVERLTHPFPRGRVASLALFGVDLLAARRDRPPAVGEITLRRHPIVVVRNLRVVDDGQTDLGTVARGDDGLVVLLGQSAGGVDALDVGSTEFVDDDVRLRPGVAGLDAQSV